MDGLCVATEPPEIDDDSTTASSRSDPGPSLFQEIDEAMNLCTLSYTLTMLRRLVREGKVQQRQDDIMRLPLSLDEANELVLHERFHLTLSKYSENKRVFTNIVKTLADRQYYLSHGPLSPNLSARLSRSISDTVRSMERRDPPKTVHVSSCFLSAFGGETTHNGLVYSMSVNIERKTVTLCFRGAETDVDWAPLNKKVFMKDIPNPMKRHSSQSETVKIHNQLHELLIEPTLRSSGADWHTVSEYREILEEHVVPTLLEHPNYKLNVTGHSLGGALATLFAFLVAAEPDSMIPKPVTCISVGSSYVGDGSFRGAHQLMEGLRKLRHVRISNQKDMVTLSPKMSFRWKLFDYAGYGGTPFKHVGMNLRLYPKGMPFEISYPSVQGNIVAGGIDELTRAWDNSLMTNLSCNPGDFITWPLHQIREYNKRILRNKESLEVTTLDALYDDSVIVGNLHSFK